MIHLLGGAVKETQVGPCQSRLVAHESRYFNDVKMYGKIRKSNIILIAMLPTFVKQRQLGVARPPLGPLLLARLVRRLLPSLPAR